MFPGAMFIIKYWTEARQTIIWKFDLPKTRCEVTRCFPHFCTTTTSHSRWERQQSEEAKRQNSFHWLFGGANYYVLHYSVAAPNSRLWDHFHSWVALWQELLMWWHPSLHSSVQDIVFPDITCCHISKVVSSSKNNPTEKYPIFSFLLSKHIPTLPSASSSVLQAEYSNTYIIHNIILIKTQTGTCS